MFHAHNRDLTPPNEPITLESVKETVQAFIDTKIVPSIINQEVENKVYVYEPIYSRCDSLQRPLSDRFLISLDEMKVLKMVGNY